MLSAQATAQAGCVGRLAGILAAPAVCGGWLRWIGWLATQAGCAGLLRGPAAHAVCTGWMGGCAGCVAGRLAD